MKRAAEKKKVIDIKEPPELKTVGAGKTHALRKGGQGRFRDEIRAFAAALLVPASAAVASGLMTKLQADHQQELQVGGTDTPENMAMIEGSMNASLGSQLKNAINKASVSADTVIDEVKIDHSEKTKEGGYQASGKARELQTLLLEPKNHAGGTISSENHAKVLLWFKLD